MTTPAQIDEAVTIITDLITVGASTNPVAALAAPLLTDFIQAWAGNLKAGIAAGDIISDGGLVTKTWAADPRHAMEYKNGRWEFVDKSL